jgi:ankyrin repeat protein
LESIHLAASHSSLNSLKVLVKAGADINARDRNGFTPIEHAACNSGDKWNFTKSEYEYLALGAESGEPFRADMIHAVRLDSAEWLGDLLDKGARADMKIPDGTSLLSYSIVMTSHDKVARALLEMGANPNEEVHGWPLIHHAVLYKCYGTVEYMLRNGVDANLKDEKGYTPLDMTAVDDKGFHKMAELIREHGGDSGVPHRREFFIAVRRGEIEKVAELIEKGVDPSSKDAIGQSALYLALNGRPDELVVLLVEKWADVNAVSPFGKIPILQKAVHANRSVKILKLLLDKGADVNGRNIANASALHVAVEYQYVEAIKVLLARGADLNIRNGTGKTPLDIAKDKDSKEIITLLTQPAAEEESISGGTGK